MITNKRIFVTGGAGFIGSNLVETLVKNNNKVIVADTLMRGNKIPKDVFRDIQFYKEDVRSFDAIKNLSRGCDLIFHFAALLGVDIVADNPVETMETEVLGMQNIVNAALANCVEKIIYASTSGVYGHSAINKAVTEDIHLDPRTSYSIAKRYNEIYLMAQYEEKGLQSISLRLFNVYGHRQDNRMVIPKFIQQALQGQSITVYGDGNQTRDFTFIDDTIAATLKLTEIADGCDIFNIANEQEASIKTLAEKIKEITESSSEITFTNPPTKRYDYEVERRYGNSEKLFRLTGYKPTTTLDDGIRAIL